MATDDALEDHRLCKEEQGPSVQADHTHYSVAKCTVTEEAVGQQQQHCLPFALWESVESSRWFTAKEPPLSETLGIPSTDSVATFQGHHTQWRSMQQPTLHVLVGLRETETSCSCTEESQLLPVAHFGLSSTGCSD